MATTTTPMTIPNKNPTPTGPSLTMGPQTLANTPISTFPPATASTSINPSVGDIGVSTRSMKTTTPQFIVNSKAATTDLANAKTTAENLSTDIQNKLTTNAANNLTKQQTAAETAKTKQDQDLINAKISALSEGTGTSGVGVSGTSGTTAEPYKLSESAMKNMTRYSDGSADVTFEDGTTKHLTATDVIAQNEADDFNKAQKFSSAIDNIYSGATPLHPEQQAQIENLKNIYADLIKKQGIMNTTNLGIAQVGGYRSGIAEDEKFTTGYIQAITDEGIRKVTNLQTEMTAKVSELTTALRNENVKEIKTAYDALDSARESLDKSFKETVKNIKDSIDAAQKAQQEQYNQTITSIVTNSSYSYEQKAQAFDQVKDKGVLTPAQMITIQTELTKQRKDAEVAKAKADAEFKKTNEKQQLGLDLSEALNAINSGKDPAAIRRIFLQEYPTYASYYDSYMKGSAGSLTGGGALFTETPTGTSTTTEETLF